MSLVSAGQCLNPSNAESRIYIQLTVREGGDEECGREGNSQGGVECVCVCVCKGPHVPR